MAAAPLDADAAPLSDPFRRSVGLLDLLTVRARQPTSSSGLATDSAYLADSTAR